MEKIKSHIRNSKLSDKRAEELFNITEQNFTFSEDAHEGEYYKNKAKDLFYRDENDYFLKEVWFSKDYTKNFDKIINYINQLTPNNSVVIIALGEKKININNLTNSTESFLYKNLFGTKKYPPILYSIHELHELNLTINDKNPSELIYYPNEFISKYMINNITKRKGEVIRTYKKLEPSNNYIQFNLLNETRFGIPKVYVNLYFFHPFLRPNITNDTNNNDKDKDGINIKDNYFFSIILYLSYIEREKNLVLADAIRAGNTFNVYYSESYFFIDVFCYSDKLEKILEIIKGIISSNKNDIINQTNFAIYRDNALEDFGNYKNVNIRDILKLEFFKELLDKNKNFPPIYNYYNFSATHFQNETKLTNLAYINPPILYAFILGYYEESEAKKIYDSFIPIFNNANFINSLFYSGYNESQIDSYKFVNYSLTRDDLKETTVKYIKEINKKYSYSFMIFSEYSYENRVAVELLKKMFEKDKEVVVDRINQKYIYLRFYFNNENIKNTSTLKEYILEQISQKEGEYMKQIDIIGGKYYYLLKNMNNKYTENPYTMRQSAISYSFDQLYDSHYSQSYYLDNDDYKNFTKTIKEIFLENENYCEFSSNSDYIR